MYININKCERRVSKGEKRKSQERNGWINKVTVGRDACRPLARQTCAHHQQVRSCVNTRAEE